MCCPVSFPHFSSSSFINANPYIAGLISSEQIGRIKEIASGIFSRIAAFISHADSESNQINVKTLAMISCISLIALLVISILRQRDTRILPPPTPGRHTQLM